MMLDKTFHFIYFEKCKFVEKLKDSFFNKLKNN